MLSRALRREDPLTLLQQFDNKLSAIWLDSGKGRLGLAVSGGVDSMALASLCNRSSLSQHLRGIFTAFIVDHDLRHGSAIEAELVAERIRELDIDAKVLKLSWPTDDFRRLPNVESAARRLRFQALGSACYSHNIRSLLLAHHADDQAETVLFRLLRGYTGSGLQGIKARAGIPECYGIWGVGRSGSPRLVDTLPSSHLERQQMIEDGGIQLYRPLLDSSKHDLKAHCLEHNVGWVEDVTNSDLTLTPRNAIRSLLSKKCLPGAISTKSLQSIAYNTAQREDSHEQAVAQVFNGSEIRLDIRSGSVKIKLPVNTLQLLQNSLDDGRIRENSQYRAAVLVRRVSMLASPLENIALQDLESAVRLSFPSLYTDSASVFREVLPQGSSANFAKVIFKLASDNSDAQPAKGHGKTEWLIQRTKPTSQEFNSSHITLPTDTSTRSFDRSHVWSSWVLFDGRFWIRVLRRTVEQADSTKIFVRFFRPEDLASLSQNKSEAASYKQLKRTLRARAPGDARFTLPAIVEATEIVDIQGQNEIVERLIALPSIGWSIPGWKECSEVDEEDDGSHNHWDIRYKKVEFWSTDDGKHCFVG